MCPPLDEQHTVHRLDDDYVPTGYLGYKLKIRAVQSHEFGLDLSPEDKRALIDSLKIL